MAESIPKKSQRVAEKNHHETRETNFINDKYLKITRLPRFDDFASKLTSHIAIYSTNFESSNAYKLMLTWIKYYNTAVRLHRTPQTPLKNQ